MPGGQVGRSVTALAAAVRAGERRALAQAITRIESTRADHRSEADALLALLLPHSGKSVRLGVTGIPGVGKSTFIEAFGLHVIGAGHRVAVLAVDPSSRRSGGSILGDKTRMVDLSQNPAAFIRPSPAGMTLGGVARRTVEKDHARALLPSLQAVRQPDPGKDPRRLAAPVRTCGRFARVSQWGVEDWRFAVGQAPGTSGGADHPIQQWMGGYFE